MSVFEADSERSRLSVQKLNGDFRAVRTLLVWRNDAPQAKIAALAEMSGISKPKSQRGSGRIKRK